MRSDCGKRLRKAILLLGSMLSQNFLHQKNIPTSVEETWRIHPKFGPKSTKNASGSTRKPPRAPTKQPTQFYCNFLSLPGPSGTSVFTNFGSKIVEKWLQKISQKTDSPKTYCFSVFFSHFAKISKKAPILGLQNGSRETRFSVFFRKRQNVTKAYYIHTFVGVGRSQNGPRIG